MNPSIQSLKVLAVALAVASSACAMQAGDDAQTSQTEQLSAQSAGGNTGGGQKAFVVGEKQRNPLLLQPSLGGAMPQQHVEEQLLLNTGDPSNGDTTSDSDGNDPTPVPWAPVARSSDIKSNR